MKSMRELYSGDMKKMSELLGVMGIQDVQDVTLMRHAYVRTERRNQGIGGKLLSALRTADYASCPNRHLGSGGLGGSFL